MPTMIFYSIPQCWQKHEKTVLDLTSRMRFYFLIQYVT